MQLRPRLQLIAPYQIRLVKGRTIGFDEFKKDDVVTIEKAHADNLIEKGLATSVKESEGVESVNRWEQVKATGSKKQEALNAALSEAADKEEPAKSATMKTDEALVAVDADKAGVSTKVTRSPQA